MNFVGGFIRFSNLLVHTNDIMDLGADVGYIFMQACIFICRATAMLACRFATAQCRVGMTLFLLWQARLRRPKHKRNRRNEICMMFHCDLYL